jgi:hypothetical protein
MVDAPQPFEGKVDRPAGLLLSATCSDVPPPSHSLFVHHQGVIHAAISDGSVANAHYYVHDVCLWPIVVNWLQTDFGFDQLAFTPYSSPTAWTNNIGADAPLTNVLTSLLFLQEVMENSHRKPAGQLPPSTRDQHFPVQQEPPALFSPLGIL